MKHITVVFLCFFSFIKGDAQNIVDSLFNRLREYSTVVTSTKNVSFLDTLDMYECFIKKELQIKDSSQKTIVVIGQVHTVMDSALFFTREFQKSIIQSQYMVSEILKKNSFPIIGNEGLAWESPEWSYVSTLDMYQRLKNPDLRYRAVERLYVQKKISNIFPIESAYIHKLHIDAILSGEKKLIDLLTQLRSYLSVSLLLHEMRQKGYRRGALVLGTYHIRDVVQLSIIAGFTCEVKHTSQKPLTHYFKTDP